jgi:hypothetical protein
MSILSKFQREPSDNSYLRLASWAVAPLGVFAFWVGMLMAVSRYPSEYDWRYMTISSLLSPGRNPAGHLWASGGIVLCGICGLCWAAVLSRRLNYKDAGSRPGGIWALRLASFCMAGAAVLPQWLLRIPKGHEILALLAFAGLSFGIVNLTFHSIARTFLRRSGDFVGRPRTYAAILSLPLVSPILLAGFAQAYVFYALPELHWVNLSWRARGAPAYLSFAFWEWVMCAVLSAYMIILPLTMFAGCPRANRDKRLDARGVKS